MWVRVLFMAPACVLPTCHVSFCQFYFVDVAFQIALTPPSIAWFFSTDLCVSLIFDLVREVTGIVSWQLTFAAHVHAALQHYFRFATMAAMKKAMEKAAAPAAPKKKAAMEAKAMKK